MGLCLGNLILRNIRIPQKGGIKPKSHLGFLARVPDMLFDLLL